MGGRNCRRKTDNALKPTINSSQNLRPNRKDLRSRGPATRGSDRKPHIRVTPNPNAMFAARLCQQMTGPNGRREINGRGTAWPALSRFRAVYSPHRPEWQCFVQKTASIWGNPLNPGCSRVRCLHHFSCRLSGNVWQWHFFEPAELRRPAPHNRPPHYGASVHGKHFYAPATLKETACPIPLASETRATT